MHSFEVHSNESACRKSGRLGLEQVCISAMLLRSDMNKWRLSQFEKIDNLYINSASNRLLQIYKIDLIEYKNQIFPKKHTYI